MPLDYGVPVFYFQQSFVLLLACPVSSFSCSIFVHVCHFGRLKSFAISLSFSLNFLPLNDPRYWPHLCFVCEFCCHKWMKYSVRAPGCKFTILDMVSVCQHLCYQNCSKCVIRQLIDWQICSRRTEWEYYKNLNQGSVYNEGRLDDENIWQSQM